MPFALIASFKARIGAAASTALWAGLAVLLGLVSASFFIAALYVWLSAEYSALTACVVIGIGFAALTILTLVIMLVIARRRRRLAADPLAALAVDLAGIDAQFSHTMKGPQGKYVLLAALAAGWLFSRTVSKR
jgi:hypothetical protein